MKQENTIFFPHPRFDFCSTPFPYFTDEALQKSTGVRICFSGREGGVSTPPFDSLNLSPFLSDDSQAVEANRTRLLSTFGAENHPCITPRQVHGISVLEINDPMAFCDTSLSEPKEADGVFVSCTGVGALLSFADCVPVIIVSSSGSFAVVHAGWRGALAGIVGKTIARMAVTDDPRFFNLYIGPHIGGECFEVSPEVAKQFTETFGPEVGKGNHIDLSGVVTIDALRGGVVPERIGDCGICTACSPRRYFSYRGSGGTCGRQGAFAIRLNEA